MWCNYVIKGNSNTKSKLAIKDYNGYTTVTKNSITSELK